MSSRSGVFLSGAVALILAVGVIAAAALTGIPVPFTSRVINPGAPPGIFSILLTDPPYVPQGVTSTYITYNDLALHISGLPFDSGWIRLGSQGTIDTLGLVNVSQTISSTKVPSGSYNVIRLNISSAIVTYAGKNYTAFVKSNLLLVPIVGGIDVSASKPSATLVDIQPAIINIGVQGAPEFAMNPVARAAPVPSTAENEINQVGYRSQLQSKKWFHQISHQLKSHFDITSASLTTSSLAVTVRNSNKSGADLKLVVVSPLITDRGHLNPVQVFTESAIFFVKPDGTLQQVQPSDLSHGIRDNAHALFASVTGYELAVGATKTLSFSGTITTPFGSPHIQNRITPGAPYLVTVIGDQLLVSVEVTSGQ